MAWDPVEYSYETFFFSIPCLRIGCRAFHPFTGCITFWSEAGRIARPRGVLLKNNRSQSNLDTTPTILLLQFEKSSRTYFFFSGGKGSIAFGAIPRSRIVVQSVSFDPYDVDSSEKTVSATPWKKSSPGFFLDYIDLYKSLEYESFKTTSIWLLLQEVQKIPNAETEIIIITTLECSISDYHVAYLSLPRKTVNSYHQIRT